MTTLRDVAIVGGSTLLGKELADLLEASAFPLGEVRLLTPREPEEPGLHATLTDFGGEAVVETVLAASDIEGADVVFVCDAAAHGHPSLRAARRLIDVTARPLPDHLPVVAGVNDEAARGQGLLRSPHASAILVSHLLHALRDLDPIDATATVLLGASDFGRPGIEELLEQTKAALLFTTVPHAVFPQQLAFNLLPPRRPLHGAAPVEEGIERDVRTVAGRPASIALVRVPTFYGVACCLRVRLSAATAAAAPAAAAMAALRTHPVIALRLDEDASPVGIAGEDGIVVGAVADDGAAPGAIWIWAVCDNARRGGALNAVEVALQLVAAPSP